MGAWRPRVEVWVQTSVVDPDCASAPCPPVPACSGERSPRLLKHTPVPLEVLLINAAGEKVCTVYGRHSTWELGSVYHCVGCSWVVGMH